MKWFLVVLLFASAIADAENFKLNDGTEYTNVKILRIEPDGIMVRTRTGIVKLFFTDLPGETQEKYHYDPKKAEAFRFRLDAARDAAADEVSAAKERREFAGNARRQAERPDKATASRQINGLSLEAHEIGTADGTYNRWYIDSITYSRDFLRQKTLLITLRDFSKSVSSVTLHVYFVAHPTERDIPLFIYGHVVVPVDLNGELELRGTIEAPPLPANVTNLGDLRLVHGADIDGWIVVGEWNGQPFQIRASRQRLLDLAEREPQRFAAMVTAYESKHRRR